MSIYSRNEEFRKGKRFSIGSRVHLVKIGIKTTPSVYSPLKGSEYECLGTIHRLDVHYCEVIWDNGHISAAIYQNLARADKTENKSISNPNITFKFRNA